MPKIKIQVHIEQKTDEDITRLAKKVGLEKPELIRNLLSLGLDDALLLEKVGVLSVILKAGELKNKLKQHFLFDGKKEMSLDDLKE